MSDRERSLSRNGSRSHATKERKMSRDQSGSRSRTPIKSHKKYTGSVSPEGYRRYRTRSRSDSVGRRGGGGAGGGGYRGGGDRATERSAAGRYSHSRSRSYSPRAAYSRRSHSHSPMSSRRRHMGDREAPELSRCLGIFGLSIYTTELQINHIFSKYGPVERVQVVIDAKTGRSRGFCFVYYESSEDAKVAKEQCTGMEIDGRRIRVDYSITQRAHTPTPGIYMGKATFVNRDSGGGYREERRDRRDKDDYYGSSRSGGYGVDRGEYSRGRRSPSPYYRGSRRDSGRDGGSSYRRSRYERSRSRSYSPRKSNPAY